MSASAASKAPHWLERLAHDLRGPLMPLQTAAFLLRSGQLEPERQQELVVLVERQTQRLARMIDELGDWSRACQHTLLGPCQPCEPALLLDNAIGGARLAGQSRPQIIDEAGAVFIHGDPRRLTQLLRTLVEHATARAGAAPQVHMHSVEGVLRIEVSDTGAAPEPAQLATLLEEPMPDPLDEGLGLQLLVARAIAEAHAGTLTAEAAPDGGGLRLRCQLPLSH